MVRESAAGIARHLATRVEGADRRGVVVGHDARHRSRAFADDCAEVVAAHGIPVRLFARPVPTPVAVFAIRELGAAAGLVVTASHNPPADNGLKLYGADGAQIVPPVDGQVAAAIDAVAADGRVDRPRGPPPAPVEPLARAVIGRLPRGRRWRGCRPRAAPDPHRDDGHARGRRAPSLGRACWPAAGHDDVHPVPEQEAPDPDFPTVAFPNPEEPGATDLLARRDAATRRRPRPRPRPRRRPRRGARAGSRRGAPPTHGRRRGRPARRLAAGRGDLGSRPAGRLERGLVVAAGAGRRGARGARHAETLTGFKWLSRPAMEHPELVQVLAYEEALGYAIGPEVRDKDGLSAALAVASMAAAQARPRAGRCSTRSTPCTARHGAHVTDNFSLRDEAPGGAARRAALVGAAGRAPAGPHRATSGVTGRARAWRPTCCASTSRAASASSCAPAAPSRSSSATARRSSRCAGGPSRRRAARARERLAGVREGLADAAPGLTRAPGVPRSPDARPRPRLAGPVLDGSGSTARSGSPRWTATRWRSAPRGWPPARSSARASAPASSWRCAASTSPRSRAPTRPARCGRLCARALRPDPDDPTAGRRWRRSASTARWSAVAARRAGRDAACGSPRWPGAFPSGQSPLPGAPRRDPRARWPTAPTRSTSSSTGARCWRGGSDVVHDEVAASKEACGDAHLKTILETGELGSYETVRLASMVAMAAGSDVIKTSTGKLPVSATPAVALCMAEAIREYADATGREVGLKLAGGIRTSKQALGYLALVAETLGTGWLTPDRFRLGASTLLNDIVLQRRFARTGPLRPHRRPPGGLMTHDPAPGGRHRRPRRDLLRVRPLARGPRHRDASGRATA